MHKFRQREEMKKQAHINGHHHQAFESSEEEEEEEEKITEKEEANQDYEKKRKKRTKEEIEREVLLMGDLYGILGLDHLSYEAGDNDIKTAYKKLALQFHPDKLGDKITS